MQELRNNAVRFSCVLLALGPLSYGGGQEPDKDPARPLPKYRFSAKKKTVITGASKKETLEEGALSIGQVTEQVALPESVRELGKKGTAAVAAKKWDQARGFYLEMVKLAPDNALALANLGVVEHQLKNLTAAQANLQKSVQINPTIAQNWLTLGLIQYERGDLSLAISSLTRAIHENPNEGSYRMVLAAVVRDYGWEEAAITELKRALIADPKLADAHFNLALTYLGMSPPKVELAKRHYYSAVDLGAEKSTDIEQFLLKVSMEAE